MITRPLDLASRLRPPPRNFDTLFYVNIGVVALAFTLFGSRFVLAPGFGVHFQLPEKSGAHAQAQRTTHDIAVNDAGLIIAEEGSITLQRLEEWLVGEAKKTQDPVLLVRAEAGMKMAQVAKIVELAEAAGFRVVCAVQEPAAANSKP